MRSGLRIGIIGFTTALLLSSCASLSLRAFNPRSHGSVYVEWPPHRNAEGWWYVTGVLHGAGNELWLYEFTIFHLSTGLERGYALDLALTNYETGRHLFEEYSTTSAKKAFPKGNTIFFEGDSIALSHSGVSISAHSKQMSFSLRLAPEKPPVWQGDNGVEALGFPSSAHDVSYYYSFTRLRTTGSISYENAAGKRVRRTVHGSSWLDRQWGHFGKAGWDWFSLRLFNGTDIMLYSIPKTGVREGTIVGPKGRVRRILGFSYTTDAWQVHGNSRYGLEWRLDLASIGKRYRIQALSRNDFNPSGAVEYWEGLCRVYDGQGRMVGYAVEETTATAHSVS